MPWINIKNIFVFSNNTYDQRVVTLWIGALFITNYLCLSFLFILEYLLAALCSKVDMMEVFNFGVICSKIQKHLYFYVRQLDI